MSGQKQDDKMASTVQVPSEDPPVDPHSEYQASEKNKDSPDKPVVDEKIVDMSEEDLKLKESLDQCVARVLNIKSTDEEKRTALQSMLTEIRSSTSSMTSVPKPLKFLRPHFAPLKAFFEALADSEIKTLLADVLSVLAMTMGAEDKRESLKFRLLGSKQDISSWGHEYIRNLTGEVSAEFQSLEGSTQHLDYLIQQIVAFYLTHSGECDACDLLAEVDKLELMMPYLQASTVAKDVDTLERIGAYLARCASYEGDAEDRDQLLGTAFDVYLSAGSYVHAVRIAMRLQSAERVQQAMSACTEVKKRQQLALIVGSQRFGAHGVDDEALAPLLGNTLLNEHFLSLARDLDVAEVKSAEDIYKSHLADGSSARVRTAADAEGSKTGVDSAKQNLAESFVNAFVNAGHGKDSKLLTGAAGADSSDWLFKHKDTGVMSATAALGLVSLWDLDNGYSAIDKYMHSKNAAVQAGAVLATGMLSANVTSEMDAAIALLGEYLDNPNKDVRLAAILGLGMAYAGSGREDVLEMLNPLVVDTSLSVELSALAALSLGLVFSGTGNDLVCGSIMQAFMDRTGTDLADSAADFLCLALGLLFMGRGDMCETVLETLNVVEHAVVKRCAIIVEAFAHAGSGSVLMVQKLMGICGEHHTEEDKATHQGAAVVGLAAVAMGESVGAEMLLRLLDNLLQYGDQPVRRAIPLAYALLCVSDPRAAVVDTLSKLSHDTDEQVSQNAVLALGFVGAGTNQSRVAQLLRTLAVYYAKEPNHLFLVRIAQGLLHMGKGLLTLSPFHSDSMLTHQPAMGALLLMAFISLDAQHHVLGSRHYLLYLLSLAMRPRMLRTLDADTLKPVVVSVRVGSGVDTVGQGGRPKTITGFQTHSTPVLLAHGNRAELASDEWVAFTPVLEGVVLVKKNLAAEANEKA